MFKYSQVTALNKLKCFYLHYEKYGSEVAIIKLSSANHNGDYVRPSQAIKCLERQQFSELIVIMATISYKIHNQNRSRYCHSVSLLLHLLLGAAPRLQYSTTVSSLFSASKQLSEHTALLRSIYYAKRPYNLYIDVTSQYYYTVDE